MGDVGPHRRCAGPTSRSRIEWSGATGGGRSTHPHRHPHSPTHIRDFLSRRHSSNGLRRGSCGRQEEKREGTTTKTKTRKPTGRHVARSWARSSTAFSRSSTPSEPNGQCMHVIDSRASDSHDSFSPRKADVPCSVRAVLSRPLEAQGRRSHAGGLQPCQGSRCLCHKSVTARAQHDVRQQAASGTSRIGLFKELFPDFLFLSCCCRDWCSTAQACRGRLLRRSRQQRHRPLLALRRFGWRSTRSWIRRTLVRSSAQRTAWVSNGSSPAAKTAPLCPRRSARRPRVRTSFSHMLSFPPHRLLAFERRIVNRKR